MAVGIYDRCDRTAGRWPMSLVPLAVAWLVGSVAAAAQPDGFRTLAPGVLTVIAADRSADDPVQRADIVEITEGQSGLAWTPKHAAANTTFVERARDRELLRDIWCLEFAFKPPRLIDVDVPIAELKMRRKRLWYLVYRVKNTGGRRVVADAEKADESRRKAETFERPIRFVPHFVLESLEPLTDAEGIASYRAYLDRVVPSAMEAIRRREDPRRRFHDSASMAATEIAPGEERWGVAMWEDIDPRIDYFSIYVRGLTNAIRWRPRPGAQASDAPGTVTEEALESLRLDFWLPGDDRDEVEEEMAVGYAGLFERMTLGNRLLSALGEPTLTGSRPEIGLERLGLTWNELVAPQPMGDAGGDVSLMPLETILRKVAAIEAPADRGPAVRGVFGDIGIEYIEELTRALAAPADVERDAERRQALEAIGLSPERVREAPLESLAVVMRALEAAPTIASRMAAERPLFGEAAPRVEWLAREAAMVRTLGTLQAIDADRTAIAAGDARAAFEALRPAVDSEADPAKRAEILRGLFGPRGPALYAAAVAVNEGIDHAWVFRYETDGSGL